MALIKPTVCQRLWRHVGILNQCSRVQTECVKVTYCSKPFNIADIAKANQVHNSFDGTKKPVVKKRASKTKSSKTKDAGGNEANKTENSTTETTTIPDWFKVVLNGPLYPDGDVDMNDISEFKLFLEEIELKSLPSVTKIIKETEPKYQAEVLRKWKERKTKELGGEKQFEQYQQEILDKGSNLHQCIEMKLSGETDFTVLPKNQGHWESVQHVLSDVSDVRLMEQQCVHPEMFYKGKFDCIANFRDTLCLIEWKTSSTLKPLLSNTYDNPLQVAAYIGAINRSNLLQQLEIPKITTGALVLAYQNGEPATVHVMNQRLCEKYWNQWLNRLFLYWTMKYKDKQTEL